ncbi:bifunctional diguanylate cyclase/phosphodiesterase [Marinithermus hydrothermalis]|uniref:Diguanylate cyclase/phosphodiesterase with PAS/PAC and GAF sensor(S) n=1 Tax=Marinithermus hydrothermalis (strain DSM 14884 / JCM 11576 / T1) TaxID=869210 RepID=F2NNH4_MARHT|nr:EAL domain-containing protein [Marinithermus hydrothermalis]AEB10784.1 diguanylate cyclase/phosphodiesterase with PAS/PAC and GAF sensor(s) [Marinithermus hydrothermalis DSM 14884]
MEPILALPALLQLAAAVLALRYALQHQARGGWYLLALAIALLTLYQAGGLYSGLPPRPLALLGTAAALALTASTFLLEHAQRSETAREHAALNAVEDLVLHTDRDGRVDYLNAAAEHLLGRSNARNLTLEALLAPQNPALLREAFQHALQGKTVQLSDLLCQDRYGTPLWLELTLRPLTDRHRAVCGVRVTGRNTTFHKRVETVLRQYDRLLREAAGAAHLLLSGRDLDWALNKVLATLGTALEVHRVYLYENRSRAETGLEAVPRLEWARAPASQPSDPLGNPLRYADPPFARWYAHLASGQAISSAVRTLPEAERAALEAQGVRSLLVVPIFVQERFWGFIGFEDHETERAWPESERSVLHALAASIGAALERHQRERELRLQRSLLAHIHEATAEGILAAAPSWEVLFYNRRFLEMWKLDEPVLHAAPPTLPRTLAQKTVAPDRTLHGLLRLHEHPQAVVQATLTLRDGRILEVHSAPLKGGGTPAGGRVWFFRDVTRQKRLEEALRRSKQRFRALVQHSSDITYVLDARGQVRYVSPSVQELLGHPPRKLTGRPFIELIHEADRGEADQALERVLQHPGKLLIHEFRARHGDGTYRWLEVRGKNLLHDSSVRGIVINARDVTQRKRYEAQVEQLAYYDPLTQLANRRFLQERAQQAITHARRYGESLALLYLDLDRFKQVNDSLGHEAGDELLAQVAARLRRFVRESDTLARLGGDEFVLLLTEAGQEEASRSAERLVKALRQPFSVRGHTVSVEVSIGIALYPQDGSTFETLMRRADAAMYRAKNEHRGFQFYAPDPAHPPQTPAELEVELRRALQEGGLVLHYQPVRAVEDQRLVGREALLRWWHPQHGELRPAHFLPLAKQAGLGRELDRWVLQQAVRQSSAWPASQWVAVNLSTPSLCDPEFPRYLEGLLETHALPPQRLLLEVTEDQALHEAGDALQALQSLGVRLALDDFGKGRAALEGLQGLAVDLLKIDREFIQGLPHHPKDASLSRALITLAHHLGARALAEGVETPAQLEWLRAAGCDLVQGYLTGRPEPLATSTRPEA